MNNKKKLVIIGGGTGSFVVLSGLRKYPLDLTAVVNVTDSGGSTGRLRTEFGFLPVGDMRQCLAALASEDRQNDIKNLLLYRFSKGQGLSGHNLGNLILTALTDITGSEPKAIETASQIFKLEGKVLPITTTNTQLIAKYEDGTKALGEHNIDEPKHLGGKKIIDLKVKPQAHRYDLAAKAIKEANLIILGPGDLYTSILPNLVINGMREVFHQTKAKLVYIVNLMTRFSQTHSYTALDHIKEIYKYIRRWPDVILINNRKIPSKIMQLYVKEKGYPVIDDLTKINRFKIIRKDFLSPVLVKKSVSDKLQRSYLRHDSEKLAKCIMGLL